MSTKRIDDLEILRGFAVLSVVLHHAHGNLVTWPSLWFDRPAVYFGGSFGVDLFFAISGFVIARDLVPRLQACSSSPMACRVTLASYDADRFLPAGWPKRALLWVGARSYAIYLIDVPVFFLMREIRAHWWPEALSGPALFYPFLLTAGVLIVVLSELNFRCIETPLRRRGARIAKQMLAGESAARPVAGQGEVSQIKVP